MGHGEDFRWIRENYARLQEKYPDMYIAVKDKQVIAHDRAFGRVYDKAKASVGSGEFAVGYTLSGVLLGL